MKILLIEDDREAASYLIQALDEAGHVTHHASDGETGYAMASSMEYDVLVVDRMLPRRDGLLVQDVDQDSVAADKGFQVGDTILEVDNKKVSTGKEFTDAIKSVQDSGRGTALIKAQRDGNVRFIGLPLNSSNG